MNPVSMDWIVPPTTQAKYTQLFLANDPARSGFIYGQQGRMLLLQTGLPQHILAQIWHLSDVDRDGRLTLEEFILAMYLIENVKRGEALPNLLPPELLPPSQRRSSLISMPLTGTIPVPTMTNATLSDPLSKTSLPPGRPPPPVATTGSFASNVMVSPANLPSVQPSETKLQRSGSLSSSSYLPSVALTEWAIPQPSKLKYTQQFNAIDRTRTGFLTGPQARNILLQSGLSQQVLATIWSLSDLDSDGRLTCEEFVLAMHLIDCVRAGDQLPNRLPQELIPPSQRRRNSSASIVSSASAPIPQGSIDLIGSDEIGQSENRKGSITTFEDKRRENFEKGQAELNRRRQQLLDQQRREQEERERKEREENEKKEKLRLEQERKKREEMERQLQKQKEMEAEKEEQRRRLLEQREAARREMERQRMIEWENQRKQELLVQKQKVQEIVSSLKSKKKTLEIEVEQVNNQVNLLQEQLDDTRNKVSELKSDIDSMRSERDTKLKEINFLRTLLKSLQDRKLLIEQDKINLSTQLKDITLTAAHGVTDSAQFALQNKQIRINQLNVQLEEMEKEKAAKLQDIENNNLQLKELKTKFDLIFEETKKLKEIYEAKQKETYEFLQSCPKVSSLKQESPFEADWGDSPSEWPAEKTCEVSKVLYRAIFAFEARNADELTIEVGDSIFVTPDSTAEPGWLHGEINGRSGWLPESYVELVDNSHISSSLANGLEEQMSRITTKESETNEFKQNVAKEETFRPQSTEFEAKIESNEFKSEKPLSELDENLVVALFQWKGTEDSHLSLEPGNTIKVKEMQGMWWFGEKTGSRGWFPATYVKVINDVSEAEKMIPIYYVSLYPFQSQEPGDLSFEMGEIVKVIKREGEWWTGEITSDRIGIFPSNYVREATSEELPKPSEPAPKSSNKSEIYTDRPDGIDHKKEKEIVSRIESVDSSPLRSVDSPKTKKSKLKKPEIYRVIASYQSTGQEQLSLEKGQLISVRKKSSSGWWEGEIQIKGMKKQIGWFPASYVKPLSGSGTGSGGSSARSTPDPNRFEEPLERVISLFSFKAQHEDELSFEENEVIKVLSKNDPIWWKGQSEATLAIGLFPSNYVEILKLDSRCKDGCNVSNNDSNTITTVSTIITSFTSHSTNTREDKRLKPILELILTERSYINDLKIVLNVFERPLRAKNILSDECLDGIFLNWSELLDTNRDFYKALKERQKYYINQQKTIEQIGDVIVDYAPSLVKVYIKFCSRQLKAATLLQKKIDNDSNFREAARSCSLSPATNGLPLGAYLLKPMQRITKYPLLVRKILENTDFDHIDYEAICKGYELVSSLCDEVNESCRTRESEERFEWIQKHIVLSQLTYKIRFASETNFMGPRKLIHFGCLIKIKGGKELVGFLFNDFLILCKPCLPIGKFSNLFACEKAMSINYRLYKKPFFLNDIGCTSDYSNGTISGVSSPTSNGSQNSCCFTLAINSLGRMIDFKAMSSNDKLAWVKNIKLATKHYAQGMMKISNIQTKKFHSNSPPIGRICITILDGINLQTYNLALNSYCVVSIGPIDVDPSDYCQEEVTKVARSFTANNFNDGNYNFFTTNWNYSMQFLLHSDISSTVICLRCYDEDPYAPHYLIGEVTIKMDEIIAEIIETSVRPLTKSYTLNSALNNKDINPKIYLKLDYQQSHDL